MKKYLNYFVFICLVFMPIYVHAAGSYSVEMVSGSANNKVIGTYNTYNEALDSMNKQNSNSNLVATIFRNGVPVDSKYAIFKFKPSGNSTFPLYRNASSSSAFTSINTSYVGDAAVLGYSDNGRVKIMVSGFTGWVNVDAGVVTPLSLLGSNMININGTIVRLRSDHSTSSSIVATLNGSYNFNYTDTYKGSDYTWYKINYDGKTAWAAGGDWVTVYSSDLSAYYNHYGPTGNLIHHFTVYSGGKYTDSFTNLGKAPSYLTKDAHYYSFDGNYFYNDVTVMLEDYRKGIYTHSVNSNNPHYSYYLYLTARSTSGYSASDLDSIIVNNGYDSSSKMYGTGSAFKEAEEKYGTNALLAFATALNESAWGMSSIAQSKNNLFGYGASDSCPYDCAYSYNSPRDSIMDYASKSSTSYETVTGSYYYGSHYGNKSSGKNIMYATDPYWGEKMAAYAYTRDLKFGGKDFNSNTIGVTKKGVYNVVVYKDPSTSSPLYTMKNGKTGDPVYDFTANIVDKVNNNGVEFYKIYTDLARDKEKFGYVLAKDFNVSNSQPVINAKDVELKIGDKFDYLAGVTASDKENGDLTNRITYEGVVDTSKEGTYSVTYSTVDNSNFHVSKKINVKVKEDKIGIPNELVYTGFEQELITKKTDRLVYFSLENELTSDNYLSGFTNVPTGVNAIDYNVYYFVPADGIHTEKKGKISVTIKKADIEKPDVKEYLGYYDGEEHTVDVINKNNLELKYSSDGINWVDNIPTFKDVGVYEIFVKVISNENYNPLDVIKSKITIKSIDDINPSVYYQTHVQNIGWMDYVKDGILSGTTGQSKRLEGIKIKLDEDIIGGVEYKTHVQNIGWMDYVKGGTISGTTGKALRLEAISVRLTGDISKYYDIYYRVHAESFGWLGWAKNDEMAGTSGYGYRLEAIEIKLVKKGDSISSTDEAYKTPKVSYKTHVQEIGWQTDVSDGKTSGTSGQAKRLEGIKINLGNNLNGNIEYSTHVQNIGWMDYVKNGEMSGTSGRALRLEAIKIRLTGQVSEEYDVYYRVHAESFGWLGWAKNDEMAGTSGYGYRLEAIEIKLVKKGVSISSGHSFISR